MQNFHEKKKEKSMKSKSKIKEKNGRDGDWKIEA